jgi:hypothetical protein
MGRCDPGDQILLKNSKCSELLQIKQERRPRHHEPNATRLGSNGRRMREISRSVQNVKQAKKRDADCTVRTVQMLTWHVRTTRGRDELAGPYDTWHSLVGRCGRMILRHVAVFGWLYGATWHPVIGWLYKIYLESTGFDPVTSTHMQSLCKVRCQCATIVVLTM